MNILMTESTLAMLRRNTRINWDGLINCGDIVVGNEPPTPFFEKGVSCTDPHPLFQRHRHHDFILKFLYKKNEKEEIIVEVKLDLRNTRHDNNTTEISVMFGDVGHDLGFRNHSASWRNSVIDELLFEKPDYEVFIHIAKTAINWGLHGSEYKYIDSYFSDDALAEGHYTRIDMGDDMPTTAADAFGYLGAERIARIINPPVPVCNNIVYLSENERRPASVVANPHPRCWVERAIMDNPTSWEGGNFIDDLNLLGFSHNPTVFDPSDEEILNRFNLDSMDINTHGWITVNFCITDNWFPQSNDMHIGFSLDLCMAVTDNNFCDNESYRKKMLIHIIREQIGTGGLEW